MGGNAWERRYQARHFCNLAFPGLKERFFPWECTFPGKGKVKGSSLDIAPLTILNSGTLQPRKWQLTGIDCSTAAHAVAAQSPR